MITFTLSTPHSCFYEVFGILVHKVSIAPLYTVRLNWKMI